MGSMDFACSSLTDIEIMLKANPVHVLSSMEAESVVGSLSTGKNPQSEAAGIRGVEKDLRRCALRVVLAACALDNASNRDRLGRTEIFEGLVKLLACDGLEDDIAAMAADTVAALTKGGHVSNQTTFCQTEGGFIALVGLLAHSDLAVVASAARAMCAACSGDNLLNRRALGKVDGVFAKLVRHLPSSLGSRLTGSGRSRLGADTDSMPESPVSEQERGVACWVACAGVLGALCGRDCKENQDLLAQTPGAVPALARLLNSSQTEEATAAALEALAKACESGHSKNQDAFGRIRGVVPNLVELLVDDTSIGIRKLALATLASACSTGCLRNQDALARVPGAFKALFRQVRHSDASLAACAFEALTAACEGGHNRNQDLLGMERGAFDTIVELMTSTDAHLALQATSALAASCGAGHAANQVLAGRTPRLFETLADMMRGPHPALRSQAAQALAVVCQHAENQDLLSKDSYGVLPALAAMLAEPGVDVAGIAAHALGACVAKHSANRDTLLQVPGVFEALGQLLSGQDVSAAAHAALAMTRACEGGHAGNQSMVGQVPGVFTSLLAHAASDDVWLANCAVGAITAALEGGHERNLEVLGKVEDVLETLVWLLDKEDDVEDEGNVHTEGVFVVLVALLYSKGVDVVAKAAGAIAKACTGISGRHKDALGLVGFQDRSDSPGLPPNCRQCTTLGTVLGQRQQGLEDNRRCLLCSGEPDTHGWYRGHYNNQQALSEVEGAFDRLVLLLKSEDAFVGAHAAWAIAKACHGHCTNKQVVGARQEVFEGVVELLEGSSAHAAMHAAGALATLCGGGHSANQAAAAKVPKVFNALMGCLSHQKAEVASYAAWAISAMCSCGNVKNQTALGSHETFKLLAKQLHGENSWSVAHAAWAMGLLCSGCMLANQDALGDTHRMLQVDVFADLALLLSSKNPQVVANAAAVLAKACEGRHAANQDDVCNIEGIHQSLVGLLHSDHNRITAYASSAVAAMCEGGHKVNQSLFMKQENVIFTLAGILECKDLQPASCAARAVGALCSGRNRENQNLVSKCGIVALLVGMLDQDDTAVDATYAVAMVCELHHENQILFRSAERAFSKLVALHSRKNSNLVINARIAMESAVTTAPPDGAVTDLQMLPHPSTRVGTPSYAQTETHLINMHASGEMHGGIADVVCV